MRESIFLLSRSGLTRDKSVTKRLGDCRIVTCGKYEKVSGAKSLSIVALNLSIYLNPKGHHYRHNGVICKAQHIMLMDPICTPLRCKPFFGLVGLAYYSLAFIHKGRNWDLETLS